MVHSRNEEGMIEVRGGKGEGAFNKFGGGGVQ